MENLNLQREIKTELVPLAPHRAVGKHLIAECWECNEQIFSVTVVREALKEAVQRTGANLLKLVVHSFEPYGVSAIAIVSESHLFIHTWPEMRYLALDVFTCGDTFPEKALEVIRNYFEPRSCKIIKLERGV
ncbi:MAG: adenosylmethionine decarboxylase [Clostridia bacterium]|nr:adenosylmethionine decarboxylase [Clostridia bacterium]